MTWRVMWRPPANVVNCKAAAASLILRSCTTLATLGTPHDIALQELAHRIVLPADQDTEDASRGLGAGG